MTTIVKGKPTYLDKIPVINKITIAAGEEREITLLLAPHVGAEGRERDASIISYFISQPDDVSETDLLLKFASDPDMFKIARIVLDLDDDEGQAILDNLTLWDIVYAFREALPYRTQQIQHPKVQEALKKLRGGDDSEEVTN